MDERTRTTVIALVCALIISVGLLAAGYVLAQGQNDIQSQRATATEVTCQQQNERHDDTLHKLDLLIAQLPKDRQKRAQENKRSTVVLIDALAPKRDCRKLVRQYVKK